MSAVQVSIQFVCCGLPLASWLAASSPQVQDQQPPLLCLDHKVCNIYLNTEILCFYCGNTLWEHTRGVHVIILFIYRYTPSSPKVLFMCPNSQELDVVDLILGMSVGDILSIATLMRGTSLPE